MNNKEIDLTNKVVINVNEYKKQDKEIFQIQIGYMKFEC